MRKYTVRNVLIHLSSGLMIVAGLGSVNAVADESPGIEEIVVTRHQAY